mgnify:CR=1 FL=1
MPLCYSIAPGVDTKSMIRLVRPSVRFKRSALVGLRESQHDDAGSKRDHLDAKKDFADFVKRIRSRARGMNLPDGYVPDSFYWLMDGSTYVGWVSIRYRLTPHLRIVGGHIGYAIRLSKRRRGYGTKILALALRKARQLGIKKVLVTCDDTNVGSIKIIERNGGVLFKKARARGALKRYYWIKL